VRDGPELQQLDQPQMGEAGKGGKGHGARAVNRRSRALRILHSARDSRRSIEGGVACKVSGGARGAPRHEVESWVWVLFSLRPALPQSQRGPAAASEHGSERAEPEGETEA
jgi:hypothetical protein